MKLEGVVEGTLVLTSTGELPIETLRPGARVLTHEHRWCSVHSVVPLGVLVGSAYTFASEHTLTCTQHQHVLVAGYTWRPIGALEGADVGTRRLFAIGGFGSSDERTVFSALQDFARTGTGHFYQLVVDSPDRSFLANRVYVRSLLRKVFT